MVFAAWQHKIRFLTLFPDQQHLQELAQEIETTLKRQTAFFTVTPPLLKTLQMELLYALLRNRTWLSTPVFAEVVLELLSTEYKLPRPVGKNLLDAVLPRLEVNAIMSATSERARNKHFLHYIFIACATALDEAQLIADLGLGTSLLRRIKAASEVIMKDGKESGERLDFLPDVDAVLGEVIVEIAEELKLTPWVMDEHRLRFILRDEDLSHWGDDSAEIVRRTFQLLLNIGRASSLPFQKISEDFSKLFGCADDVKAPDRCLHLLQLLKRKELVFVEMTQRNIPQGSWSLASLGQELTADAFACKFLRVPEPPLGRLVECCPAYQLATVRRLGRDHLTGLKQALAQDLKAFSPKALTAAIQQLARFQSHSEVMALVKPALELNDSPWLKAALCEGLTALTRDESVGQLLAAVAKSAQSRRVQKTAQTALVKWKARHREARDLGR